MLNMFDNKIQLDITKELSNNAISKCVLYKTSGFCYIILTFATMNSDDLLIDNYNFAIDINVNNYLVSDIYNHITTEINSSKLLQQLILKHKLNNVLNT